MIKIIIIFLIVIFIVLPLYRGDSVGSVINNIKTTISDIASATPQWLKDLTVKVFSVFFKLIQTVFNAIVDSIFNEAGKKMEDQKNEIKNQTIIKQLLATRQGIR
ncbi:MAG: hypothetical protein US76_00310 [Parcubacteria group bacterium GW2011_GWA2_38_13b]|nr:MAG: hypothetical protein US76_00310 [Parcubacteria group bacterium GW2011_GWA2_38_13b]